MKILKQSILVFLLTLGACAVERTEFESQHFTPGWMGTVMGFEQYLVEKGRPVVWNTTWARIPGTNYVASVGPCEFQNQEVSHVNFYGLRIEEIRGLEENHLVTELRVSLEHVSRDLLAVEAKHIVTYNEELGEIRFDLGRQLFIFKLVKEDG